MALSTRAELVTAIADWEERTFTAGETNDAILITEALVNRRMAQDWRNRATATANTNSSGVGTLPTGFVGLSSVTRNVLGSKPLTQVSNAAFVNLNPYEDSDDAQYFTLLTSTTFSVTPVTDDDFIFQYSAKITALSASGDTNWLLALAPDFYLYQCQANLLKKYKDYANAGVCEAMASGILDELIGQGNVAEFSSAAMVLDMETP